MLSDLKILVLAAGKGTRMQSLTPKVFHTLGHRPLISYVLECAEALKPSEIFLVTRAELEDRCLKDLKPHHHFTLVRQETPLGTAHAVLAARPFIEGFQGKLLVLFGDTPHVTPESLKGLLEKLDATETTAITLMTLHPKDPRGYGRVKLGEGDRVVEIIEEKEASAQDLLNPLCNGGVMALKGTHALWILERIPCRKGSGEFYLTDAVAVARTLGLETYQVQGHEDLLAGINTLSALAQSEQRLQNHWRQKFMDQGVILRDPSSTYFSYDTEIGPHTVIEPQVVLGPGVRLGSYVTVKAFSYITHAMVENHTTIGPFVHLRPGTHLKESVRIGNFVEVKNSTLEQGSKANHLSYIGDSHVGEHTNIGAGTITCNYDGVLKHRTIIGNSVFVGSNTALVAPLTIGDGVVVGAGSVVTQDVAAESLVVARAPQKVIPQGGKRFLEKRKKVNQRDSH